MQGSRRTGRARSRTDPGTLPASLSSSRGRNTQQPGHQPSNIPRRIGVSPSPAPYRPSNGAQVSDSGSDPGTVNSGQRDKRKLYVTNAEITSSSSSESQSSKSPSTNPRTPSRADSQSSTETKLRPPRFGLGLGFSGVNDPKSSMRSPQAWSTKIPTIESSPIRSRRIETPDDRGPTRDGIPKGHDRPPSRNAHADSAEGQRRHRELLSLVEAATYDSELSNECDSLASISSGYDPLPASGRGSDGFDEQYATSAGSRSSLACDDSGSEYSPAEEHDEEAIRRPSLRRERTQSWTVSGVRQSRVDLFRDSDNQHTPKASSSSSFVRHDRDYDQIHPSNQPADDFAETESLILTSDEDSSSLEESRGVSERYSSELSRIMAASNEAAAQQSQAFGIGSSLGFEDHRPGATSTLPHADSDLSSVGGEGWQYQCDDLDTGSLLQQLSRPDTSGSSDKQSLAEEHPLISSQTQSSMSQESIYSTQNSPTRRETIIYEFPSSSLTERDHKWGEFERHVLHCYGGEESRRQRFVWELADSEENFVGQLRNMVQLFILPLRARDTRFLTTVTSALAGRTTIASLVGHVICPDPYTAKATGVIYICALQIVGGIEVTHTHVSLNIKDCRGLSFGDFVCILALSSHLVFPSRPDIPLFLHWWRARARPTYRGVRPPPRKLLCPVPLPIFPPHPHPFTLLYIVPHRLKWPWERSNPSGA
ncbi:hypothetical protein BDN67DRAFT_1003204 [Paxillus ammoniavirescens]|nr:hypothetical protein BDN67DRAFT_1003204 [Paxillus ammoniavirescens]